VDFSHVTTPDDQVAIIATQPLTDNEPWITMKPGTLWMFHDGNPMIQLETRPGPAGSQCGV